METPSWLRDPASISAIGELIEMTGSRFRDDAIEVIKQFLTDKETASETRIQRRTDATVKQQTRPLQISLIGIIVAMLGSCGWLMTKFETWQASQRQQWELQQRQEDLDTRVVEHLETEHVDAATIEAIDKRLDTIDSQNARIEKRLNELVEQGKVRVGGRGR